MDKTLRLYCGAEVLRTPYGRLARGPDSLLRRVITSGRCNTPLTHHDVSIDTADLPLLYSAVGMASTETAVPYLALGLKDLGATEGFGRSAGSTQGGQVQKRDSPRQVE